MCVQVYTWQLKNGDCGGGGGKLESALYTFSKGCMYEDTLN